MTILAQVFSQPAEAVAAIAGGQEITYRDFCSDIERGAAYLRERGLGSDSTVGIFIGQFRESNDYAGWIAHLAAIRIGATLTSVHDARFLASLLEIARLDALIGELPAQASADGLNVVPFELDSLPAGTQAADEEAKAARLNLTSGTTGSPKIIRWDNAIFTARLDQVADLDLIDSSTVLDSYLAPRTTAGFRYPLATWRAGGTVLLSKGGEPTNANRTNLCICSPFQLQRMRAVKVRWANRAGRTIIALGGRVPPGLRDWALANLAGRILISYGSTEAGNVAYGDAEVTDRHPGAVGWVRDGVEVEIVDSDGNPVEPGKHGRVRLRTSVMALAEGSGPESDQWFEPGDLGVLYEDGLLAIAGRTSDVLNVGGMKMSAVDAESRLAAIDGIQDAGIVVVPTRDGELLVIAIAAREGATAAEFLPAVKPILPRGTPLRLVLVGSIPRNAMGKIDRQRLIHQLRQVYLAAVQAQREHA